MKKPLLQIVLGTDEDGQVTLEMEVKDDKSMGELPENVQTLAFRMLNATGYLRQIIEAAQR